MQNKGIGIKIFLVVFDFDIELVFLKFILRRFKGEIFKYGLNNYD